MRVSFHVVRRSSVPRSFAVEDGFLASIQKRIRSTDSSVLAMVGLRSAALSASRKELTRRVANTAKRSGVVRADSLPPAQELFRSFARVRRMCEPREGSRLDHMVESVVCGQRM